MCFRARFKEKQDLDVTRTATRCKQRAVEESGREGYLFKRYKI